MLNKFKSWHKIFLSLSVLWKKLSDFLQYKGIKLCEIIFVVSKNMSTKWNWWEEKDWIDLIIKIKQEGKSTNIIYYHWYHLC